MKPRRWILVAEDNSNDADLTVRALTANRPDLEVVVAQDGQETLDCLYRSGNFRNRMGPHPALLVLDLKMPKVNGLEVLARIKAEPALRALPVVVFTSSAEESDMFRVYELGANAYLVKPMGYRDYEIALKQLGVFWIDYNELPLGMAGAATLAESNPGLQPAHVSH